MSNGNKKPTDNLFKGSVVEAGEDIFSKTGFPKKIFNDKKK